MRPRIGRLVVLCAAATALSSFFVSAANAATLKLCMPKAEGSALLTPKHGKCKRGYTLTNLSTEAKPGPQGKEGAAGKEGKAGAEGKVGEGKEGKKGEEGTISGLTKQEAEKLKALVLVAPYMKFEPIGVGGKPTILFSSVNVQIESGATGEKPESAPPNGEGNLVVGFDEEPGEQTGSNNLVVGNEQTFTSYGGFVAVVGNFLRGPFASVSGGEGNTASDEGASVSGGEGNAATGPGTSVSGGESNVASGRYSSILGGHGVEAKNEYETSPS